MYLLLSEYIRDPLYRLAIWIIVLQLLFIVGAACIAFAIQWLKPQIDAKREKEEQLARQTLLDLLYQSQEQLDKDVVLQLFNNLSIRSIITAFEQVVTRLGEIEQRRLRGSIIALGIESYAIKLCHSWWWWRRLEGVLLLRSVGAATSEEQLVYMLNDKKPNVAFYAAWALARVSPIRGLKELITYIEKANADMDSNDDTHIHLAFSQQVTLLKELQLEYLEHEELERLFEQVSTKLKPVLIEAIIQSGQGSALPIIRKGIHSQDVEVRIASFKAAVTSKLSLSEEEVRIGLTDPIWVVRAQAVKIVGALKMLNLIPLLCQCLADNQWWVRQNSAQALLQLGSSGAEALSYVAQFGEDRFARDISRLVLSDAIMSADSNIRSALDTQPLSPLPESLLPGENSLVLDPNKSPSLLTAELTALSMNSDR